jgi:hypothetical protein
MSAPETLRLHLADLVLANGQVTATCGDCGGHLSAEYRAEWFNTLTQHAQECSGKGMPARCSLYTDPWGKTATHAAHDYSDRNHAELLRCPGWPL